MSRSNTLEFTHSPNTTERRVPFFPYASVFACNEQSFVDIFRRVGSQGAFILQDDLARFEIDLADFLAVKHALGVGNATDGLIMALRAAGIRPGDEVVLSSHTMVATAAAVHFAGGVPVK